MAPSERFIPYRDPQHLPTAKFSLNSQRHQSTLGLWLTGSATSLLLYLQNRKYYHDPILRLDEIYLLLSKDTHQKDGQLLQLRCLQRYLQCSPSRTLRIHSMVPMCQLVLYWPLTLCSMLGLAPSEMRSKLSPSPSKTLPVVLSYRAGKRFTLQGLLYSKDEDELNEIWKLRNIHSWYDWLEHVRQIMGSYDRW